MFMLCFSMQLKPLIEYIITLQELCKWNMSSLVTRLLLYMYTNQKLQVKWGGKISSKFGVLNGAKQGGVLYPYYLLFTLMAC